MKKSAKKRSKRQGLMKTRLKHEAKRKRVDPIKPVLYTRHLKSKKKKKIKEIAPPLWSSALNEKFDDPIDEDDQKAPSSFREMIRRIDDYKNKRNPYRYASNEGDTKGARKRLADEIPRQGKNESVEQYARRLDRCMQEELLKVTIAKKGNAPLVDPGTYKSEKTKKVLKRLGDKKKMRKAFKREKRLTGFEHLKDDVEFGEVVKAPPLLKTKPKKVGGNSAPNRPPSILDQ